MIVIMMLLFDSRPVFVVMVLRLLLIVKVNLLLWSVMALEVRRDLGVARITTHLLVALVVLKPKMVIGLIVILNLRASVLVALAIRILEVVLLTSSLSIGRPASAESIRGVFLLGIAASVVLVLPTLIVLVIILAFLIVECVAMLSVDIG